MTQQEIVMRAFLKGYKAGQAERDELLRLVRLLVFTCNAAKFDPVDENYCSIVEQAETFLAKKDTGWRGTTTDFMRQADAAFYDAGKQNEQHANVIGEPCEAAHASTAHDDEKEKSIRASVPSDGAERQDLRADGGKGSEQ